MHSPTLFLTPPDEFWYHCVTKITVQFSDGKSEMGSGFLVGLNDQYYLVTARHVVDTWYRPEKKRRQTQIQDIEIAFGLMTNTGTDDAGYARGTSKSAEPLVQYSDTETDVAVIKWPKSELPILKGSNTHRPFSFATSILADSEFLARIPAGATVVFIGYPANNPKWGFVENDKELEFDFPFLRSGITAFPLSAKLRISGFLGRNYGVIDSYAQKGFSGSPLILQAVGFFGGGADPAGAWPARVIGVVCGHYSGPNDDTDGKHSGMSYFVRSDDILECLAKFE